MKQGTSEAVVKTTHRLETADAAIVYDVHGPLPTADGGPLLFMIGQPMDASGFQTLASHFPDRTVVTYDPRGLGRSKRKDGRVENVPILQARDLHALIEALGAGPVEMFASSGGAVTALALVAAYPKDVTILVAHEPPLLAVLPDAQQADRAEDDVRNAYEAKGRWTGMATFIRMTLWQGEFNDEYFAQPGADPTQFGMPADDDGSRDDPLLSGRSRPITAYRPDFKVLAAAPTRIVIAVGEESQGTVTWRTSLAAAELLGQRATVFPSHHGGFMGPEMGGGYAGKPEEFARKLREVLHDNKGQ
jgi:pimeloyl-ACP methyl ester carboxylesterase